MDYHDLEEFVSFEREQLGIREFERDHLIAKMISYLNQAGHQFDIHWDPIYENGQYISYINTATTRSVRFYS